MSVPGTARPIATSGFGEPRFGEESGESPRGPPLRDGGVLVRGHCRRRRSRMDRSRLRGSLAQGASYASAVRPVVPGGGVARGELAPTVVTVR